jgi:hypothetical protein
VTPDPTLAAVERLMDVLRRELDDYMDGTRQVVDGAVVKLLAKLDEILDRLVLLEQKVERASVTEPPARPGRAGCQHRRRRCQRRRDDDPPHAGRFGGPSR